MKDEKNTFSSEMTFTIIDMDPRVNMWLAECNRTFAKNELKEIQKNYVLATLFDPKIKNRLDGEICNIIKRIRGLTRKIKKDKSKYEKTS